VGRSFDIDDEKVGDLFFGKAITTKLRKKKGRRKPLKEVIPEPLWGKSTKGC